MLVFLIISGFLQMHERQLKLLQCIYKVLFGLFLLLLQEGEFSVPKRSVSFIIRENFVFVLL